jgi:hypothetical protein
MKAMRERKTLKELSKHTKAQKIDFSSAYYVFSLSHSLTHLLYLFTFSCNNVFLIPHYYRSLCKTLPTFFPSFFLPLFLFHSLFVKEELSRAFQNACTKFYSNDDVKVFYISVLLLAVRAKKTYRNIYIRDNFAF